MGKDAELGLEWAGLPVIRYPFVRLPRHPPHAPSALPLNAPSCTGPCR
jgi:hypothetical protein